MVAAWRIKVQTHQCVSLLNFVDKNAVFNTEDAEWGPPANRHDFFAKFPGNRLGGPEISQNIEFHNDGLWQSWHFGSTTRSAGTCKIFRAIKILAQRKILFTTYGKMKWDTVLVRALQKRKTVIFQTISNERWGVSVCDCWIFFIMELLTTVMKSLITSRQTRCDALAELGNMSTNRIVKLSNSTPTSRIMTQVAFLLSIPKCVYKLNLIHNWVFQLLSKAAISMYRHI